MAWLDDNPPRIQQFRCPRRRSPSGIIGVHTAESFPDETGPDTGAENVARFIRNRTNHGSYHLLADSDSIIQLVEFRCVAYHIGTHGLNEHTIGISAATQAAKWNTVSKGWRDATVKNMAVAAARAARWLKVNYSIDVPARRITLSQALAGQRGFLAHGDADPGRRSDPGATFPWTTFLNHYAAEMNEDDEMTPAQMRELKEYIDDRTNPTYLRSVLFGTEDDNQKRHLNNVVVKHTVTEDRPNGMNVAYVLRRLLALSQVTVEILQAIENGRQIPAERASLMQAQISGDSEPEISGNSEPEDD